MTGRATHGHTRGRDTSREFNSWLAMRQRCLYRRSEKFPRYGGRGIMVCDRWRDSFENFLADMGPRPRGKTLDRFPDRDGNYEPTNCRWATPKQQAANRSYRTPRKTHCPAGHAYAGANIYTCRDGSRKCRQCTRDRAARRRYG